MPLTALPCVHTFAAGESEGLWKTEEGKGRQGKTEEDKGRQRKAREDKGRQGKTREREELE